MSLRTLFDGPRLSDVATGTDNNLTLIRMLAALAVIVSHAWAVTGGPSAIQPLERLVGWQLGTMAVFVFFGVSGFLISASFAVRVSLDSWVLARALRIFPALAVTLLLTVFVLGPMMTELPLADYLTAADTRRYLAANLSLWFRQDHLPGLFAGLPYAGHVNVSHWTLLHEVLCYLGVMVLGLAGVLDCRVRASVFLGVAILGLAALRVVPLAAESAVAGGLAFLALPFLIGMAFHVWRERVVLSWPVLALMAGVAIVTRGWPGNPQWVILTLVYGTFVCAWLPRTRLRLRWDLSYGLYIYGFAVQQAAVQLSGSPSPWVNLALSIPAALVLAALSWRLVEDPAIRLGKAWRSRRLRAA